MASPISHIVYAQKYFEKYPDLKLDRNEFYIGCVFPDVRYYDTGIKRELTHNAFSHDKFNINKLTSFEAGWQFHIFCDYKREEILEEKGFYNISKTKEFNFAPSKLLEDILIYDEVLDWEEISLALLSISNKMGSLRLPVAVSTKSIEKWYFILNEYVCQKPTCKTIENFLSALPPVEKQAKEISIATLKLKENSELRKYYNFLTDEIVSKI